MANQKYRLLIVNTPEMISLRFTELFREFLNAGPFRLGMMWQDLPLTIAQLLSLLEPWAPCNQVSIFA